VITKTGELRAILMVSSINFSLKSEQEQTAIIFAYQNFLNSLTFQIHIVMQSKKLDLFKYMTKLKQTAKTQTNELLRYQTEGYIDFIERLVNYANIMDKKFFVVIPYMPPIKTQTAKNSQGSVKMSMEEFKSYKTELDQRIQVITNGLGSIGVRSAQLNTQQIIELFYGIYNPEESEKEKLVDADEMNAPLVESEIEKPEEKKQT